MVRGAHPNKQISMTALLLAFCMATPTQPTQNTTLAANLATYDVVWNSPSKDAAGSMPIGNGEVVLNVWVEDKTGDLRFYIGRTDALSEISRVLKLGGVCVHLEPNPFKSATDFQQHLHLHEGHIDIDGGGAHLLLFVNANSNVIDLSGTTATPTKVTASIECWRNERRILPKNEQISAWSVHDAPFELAESPDVFLAGSAPSVTWYHRNETTVVPQVLANQSLTGAKGSFDPILHRTFGGRLTGEGFVKADERSMTTKGPVSQFHISIPTHTAQTATVKDWVSGLNKVGKPSLEKTTKWWTDFWNRSWVFVDGDQIGSDVPKNDFPLRLGVDSNGQNLFPGAIRAWRFQKVPLSPTAIAKLAKDDSGDASDSSGSNIDFSKGFTLSAWIKPSSLDAGRIFDKLTAGQSDGFLFDMQPGGTLRLIVGNLTLPAPKVIKANKWQHVAATFDPKTGQAVLYLNGQVVLGHEPLPGSAVARGYLLQRYVQACQGRGQYPIKFNGGYYTVEPTVMGRISNPDWRNWGDSHWYQNVRHMYHPMAAQGDFEMMEPFFKLYESARPLAESRTEKYHNAKGIYFPETMTVWGTYSGGDYGWDRTGKQPKDVDCQYWQWAWNQGPEFVDLMLDYWDYTRDEKFLTQRLLPMAKSVLDYFDTRFKKDASGKVILDPTQVVETYWHGVVNDMPTTSGLIAMTGRLCALHSQLVPADLKKYFARMKGACPDLPLETRKGEQQLAPAQKYNTDTSNVENGELYGVWPARVVCLAHPELLAEAKVAYKNRLNHLDVGWGYDGNVAALLGMTDEAARILRVKCANSHPAFRWPATWGPNFDWIPDQNHGGNLLTETNLMLIQSESLESGGAIRLLPSWPQNWDVDFKLNAAGKTSVHCIVKSGKVVTLEVNPPSRAKDVILPAWAQ